MSERPGEGSWQPRGCYGLQGLRGLILRRINKGLPEAKTKQTETQHRKSTMLIIFFKILNWKIHHPNVYTWHTFTPLRLSLLIPLTTRFPLAEQVENCSRQSDGRIYRYSALRNTLFIFYLFFLFAALVFCLTS